MSTLPPTIKRKEITMNTILNAIKESVKALTDNIQAASAKIYEEANIRKEKLAAAIKDMRDIQVAMKQFSTIKDNFADIINICSEMEVSEQYIDEMLSDMNVYESKVETFNGYCDRCGVEMNVGDSMHFLETNEFICDECFNAISEDTKASESEEKSE